jgi:hypothetical protein
MKTGHRLPVVAQSLCEGKDARRPTFIPRGPFGVVERPEGLSEVYHVEAA